MYYLMLDTETTNSIDDPIAYDIGFAIIDEQGTIFETYSFAVAEVFLDKELMSSAYYAKKLPIYWDEINAGVRELRTMETIRRKLHEVCRMYDVKAIVAHNARFDYRSTALTKRYLTCSKYRYFLPYGVELWDTLKMAREVFKQDEAYGQFCYENDFLTKRGYRRYTAEILYRFITNNVEFEEVHMGLADVEIEAVIFAECMKRGATRCKLWEN